MPRQKIEPNQHVTCLFLALLFVAGLSTRTFADPLPEASDVDVSTVDASPEVTRKFDPQYGIRPRHWRVVWKTDPATTAMVAWNTREQGTTHRLRWRERASDGASEGKAVAFKESPAISGRFSYGDKPGKEAKLYYHDVRLTGLQPDTAYEIQFVSDDVASDTFYFVTAPTGETPFSLLFGGDSRSDRETRRKMNVFIADLIAKSETSKNAADRIVGVMHAGDYTATGTSLPLWIAWMGDHETLATEAGRLIPLIPTRGNHDRGRLFNECFGFEGSDTRNWFGTSFGSLLRVVTLNTEASIAGDQALWLRDELAKSTSTYRWVLPQYHRPGYAAVKIPGGALGHWVPLFEEFSIPLVCEGDGHVIKRTVPIRRAKHDESGVVYIGEGGMGVGQRTPKDVRWFLQPPGMCASGHHVQRLKFTPDRLSYECLVFDGARGEVIDRWEKVAAPLPKR